MDAHGQAIARQTLQIVESISAFVDLLESMALLWHDLTVIHILKQDSTA